MFTNGTECISAGHPRAQLRARPALLHFSPPPTQGHEVPKVIASETMDINSNSLRVKGPYHTRPNPLLTSSPSGACMPNGIQNPPWDGVMLTQLVRTSTLPELWKSPPCHMERFHIV